MSSILTGLIIMRKTSQKQLVQISEATTTLQGGQKLKTTKLWMAQRHKLSEAECRKEEEEEEAGDSHRLILDHNHSHRPPSPPILHPFL
jgi:hypothetical protein